MSGVLALMLAGVSGGGGGGGSDNVIGSAARCSAGLPATIAESNPSGGGYRYTFNGGAGSGTTTTVRKEDQSTPIGAAERRIYEVSGRTLGTVIINVGIVTASNGTLSNLQVPMYSNNLVVANNAYAGTNVSALTDNTTTDQWARGDDWADWGLFNTADAAFALKQVAAQLYLYASNDRGATWKNLAKYNAGSTITGWAAPQTFTMYAATQWMRPSWSAT